MSLGKIAVLFLVSIVFLTFYDFYLKPLYYDFTNAKGQDLGETLFGYLVTLGAAFILTFALMKKAEKVKAEDDSGGYNS